MSIDIRAQVSHGSRDMCHPKFVSCLSAWIAYKIHRQNNLARQGQLLLARDQVSHYRASLL